MSGVNKDFQAATDWRVEQAINTAYRQAEAALSIRLEKAGAVGTEAEVYLEAMRHHHDRVADLAESPIESIMLPWVVTADIPELRCKVIRTARPADDAYPRAQGLVIIPQLAIGRYRLDFAIVLQVPDRTLILDFECDGRAFHRDPDDAARDRYLAALGIPTVRATGAQIYTEPTIVVERIAIVLTSWLSGHHRLVG